MATTVTVTPVTGANATLGVATDLIAPWKYQWKRNGVFLPHGNDKSYVTPPLKPDDFKAKYSVVVYGQDKTEESPEVMLSSAAPKPAPVVAPSPSKPIVPPPPPPAPEVKH